MTPGFWRRFFGKKVSSDPTHEKVRCNKTHCFDPSRFAFIQFAHCVSVEVVSAVLINN